MTRFLKLSEEDIDSILSLKTSENTKKRLKIIHYDYTDWYKNKMSWMIKQIIELGYHKI
jgi:hypothetical protein